MSFIDSLITPNQKDQLKRISIIYEPQKIILWLCFYCLSDSIEIEYEDDISEDEDSVLCICESQNKRVTVENSDISTVFSEDLRAVLSHRKSVLQEFQVSFRGFEDTNDIGDFIFEAIEDHLSMESDEGRVKIKRLSLEITEIEQLTSLLMYLDSEILETVDLTLRSFDLDLKGLLEAAEWEIFEDLELEIAVDELTNDDLESAKEILLDFTNFQEIEIHSPGIPLIDYQWNNQNDHRIVTRQSENCVLLSRGPNPAFRRTVTAIGKMGSQLSKVFENQLILENILQFTDGVDIQCLRKVSQTLRRNIDFLNPDPKINHISLESTGPEMFSVTYNSKKITYHQDYCIVGNQYLHEANYRTVFINDFELIMKNQRKPVKNFHIKFNDDKDLMEMFKNYLESKNQKMKIEKLKMEIVRGNEVMAVLPFIDSKALKSIKIQNPFVRILPTELEIDEIVKLDQWSNAEEVIINTFVISTPIRLLGLEKMVKMDVYMSCISTEDLFYIKEKFLHSPTLLRLKIAFKSFSNNNNTNEPWEDLDLNNPCHWYFKSCDKCIYVLFTLPDTIIFSSIDQKLIPGTAVIRV